MHVNGCIAAHRHLTGDDCLGDVPGAYGVAGGSNGGKVLLHGCGGSHGEGSGCRLGAWRRGEVGGCITDGGDPAPPVGRLAHQHSRHHQLGGVAGQERNAPQCQRSDATHMVGVLDGGQKRRHLGEGYARCHPASGNAHTIAHEQVAVAAGDVVEIDIHIERVGDGTHHGWIAASVRRGFR